MLLKVRHFSSLLWNRILIKQRVPKKEVVLNLRCVSKKVTSTPASRKMFCNSPALGLSESFFKNFIKLEEAGKHNLR